MRRTALSLLRSSAVVSWGLCSARCHYCGQARQPPCGSAAPTLSNAERVLELKRVCDVVYRSSTARGRLCQAIHEPSPEIALRHLGEFADDPGVWRRRDWAEGFLGASELTVKVGMVLERLVQWYSVRKAPRKVVMEEPWDWYPRARLMRRSFVFHSGDTNSGKTHAALEAFTKAKSGVYCAPLKALAAQVWSRVNASVPCDLLIGDERRFGGGAEHVSCTVEMTPVDLQVDVGVIDEIQMIGDRDRGWAWTRALLGLPAREIHLCGEARAIGLVENLLYKTYERGRLTLREHKRLVPLRPGETLHGDLGNVENGDCLVCFSRKSVMDLHRALSQRDDVRSSFIYGAMPFDVRERQAEAFNAGVEREILRSKAQQQQQQLREDAPSAAGPAPSVKHVLVSTDAIAYGLNMNIERIVFTTLKKFDGKETVDVPVPTVKQICGRAGRFGLVRQHADGRYTTLRDGVEHATLTAAMRAEVPDLTCAGLLPTADILQLYVELAAKERQASAKAPDERRDAADISFSSLIRRFAATTREATGLFFPCDVTRSLLRVALSLDSVPALSLKDRILFCYLPLGDGSRESLELIAVYAREHAAGGPVSLRIDGAFQQLTQRRDYTELLSALHQRHQASPCLPTTAGTALMKDANALEAARQRCLSKLERLYRQAEMYCWLSWRFQSTFTEREKGAAFKLTVAKEMERLIV